MVKNTECMVVVQQSDIYVCNILCEGGRIKHVGTLYIEIDILYIMREIY